MPIEWEDPPPDEPRRTNWVGVAEELRDNPGKWSKFKSVDSSLVYRIKRGDYKPFPAAEFEVAIRRAGPAGDIVLYIRYVGE